MKVLGGAAKNLKKALSSSSTSRFSLPFRTCLPMGWCCKMGLEPPPLPWGKSRWLLQGESEPGKGAAREEEAESRPGLSSGCRGDREGHPRRAWGRGWETESCLTCPSFRSMRPRPASREGCLFSGAVKSADCGAGLTGRDPGCHCLPTPL